MPLISNVGRLPGAVPTSAHASPRWCLGKTCWPLTARSTNKSEGWFSRPWRARHGQRFWPQHRALRARVAAKVARPAVPCSIEPRAPPNPSINRTASGSRLSQTLGRTKFHRGKRFVQNPRANQAEYFNDMVLVVASATPSPSCMVRT